MPYRGWKQVRHLYKGELERLRVLGLKVQGCIQSSFFPLDACFPSSFAGVQLDMSSGLSQVFMLERIREKLLHKD